jgi:hypothetical protein
MRAVILLLGLGLVLVGSPVGAECIDSLGNTFSGPDAFVDGLRPHGLCLPSGARERAPELFDWERARVEPPRDLGEERRDVPRLPRELEPERRW